MPKRFLTTFALTLFLTLGSHSSHAIVTLSFDPTTSDVGLGDTFSVDLIADIPATEAINTWGLDLAFDASVLTLNSFTQGAIWRGGLGSCSLDNDEICGSALVPSVSGISLLGTFNFTAVGLGSTALDLSATVGDITEGFALLSIIGTPVGIRDWDYTTGVVNVGPAAAVPEPAILVLVATGLAGIGLVRRKARPS